MIQWIEHMNIHTNIAGILNDISRPEGVRVGTWAQTGSKGTLYYD